MGQNVHAVGGTGGGLDVGYAGGRGHLERRVLEQNRAQLVCWRRPGTGGDWVILVHPAGLDHHVFDAQISGIDARFNVLAWDHRGHGESRNGKGPRTRFDDLLGDLAVLMDQYGIAAAALVGHSYGGNVAQEFAWLHPERVERLVMIGSWGQHRPVSRRGGVSVRVAGAIYRVTPWRRFAAYSARWCSDNPETQAYIVEQMLRNGRRVYLDLGESALRQVHEVETYPRPVPTLMVRGEHDNPQALDAIWAGIVERNPMARIEIVPGSKHQPLQDHPDAFNEILNRFLLEQPVEPGRAGAG